MLSLTKLPPLSGIDVAGWSAQKLWRRFGKMYGGKGRRRFLETHGASLPLPRYSIHTAWFRRLLRKAASWLTLACHTGVENVLEMTPEEVNTRWGLECRRVYLIEHCEMKEAIDFSDEEVGRFWYERVSKDFLKEKAGALYRSSQIRNALLRLPLLSQVSPTAKSMR